MILYTDYDYIYTIFYTIYFHFIYDTLKSIINMKCNYRLFVTITCI